MTTQTVTNEPPSLHSDRVDRRLFFGFFGLVLAIVVSVVVWWAWGSYAMGGVEVTTDESPVCTGTTLRPDNRTIEAKPGMSCVYTVTVRNDGPVGIHLDSTVLTILGKGGGAVIMAAAIDGRKPGEGAHDVDAEIALDHEVESGEAWSFRLRVVYRPDGCTSAGWMTIYDLPTVHLSYLGRDAEASGDTPLLLHNKRQNPGCR